MSFFYFVIVAYSLLKCTRLQKHALFYQILRGKAAECITVIAVAVGRDMFSADAEEVASALLEMQEALEPSDSLEGYAAQLHISVYFAL